MFGIVPVFGSIPVIFVIAYNVTLGPAIMLQRNVTLFLTLEFSLRSLAFGHCRMSCVSGTTHPVILSKLGADSAVDAFIERTSWRVDCEVLLVLLEVLDIVISQPRDFVDVTDLLVGTIGCNLAGGGGKHAGEVLVVSNRDTIEVPFAVRGLLLGLVSVIIKLLAEGFGNFWK
jgi:hypothetical protein